MKTQNLPARRSPGGFFLPYLGKEINKKSMTRVATINHVYSTKKKKHFVCLDDTE